MQWVVSDKLIIVERLRAERKMAPRAPYGISSNALAAVGLDEQSLMRIFVKKLAVWKRNDSVSILMQSMHYLFL